MRRLDLRLALLGIALLGACSDDAAPSGAAGSGGRGGAGSGGRGQVARDAAPADAAGGSGGSVARPDGGTPDGGPAAPGEIAGEAAFDKRVASMQGLAMATTRTPIAGADVELADAANRAQVYATTRTDAQGRYRFALADHADAAGKMVVVRVLARVQDPAFTISVVDGEGTRVLYAASSEPVMASATAGVTLDLVVDATPGMGRAGAFNLLAVTSGCARHVLDAVMGTLPPLEIRWRAGNSVETEEVSFFTPDGAMGALYILGGTTGMVGTSDTDEFDDGVLAHEYGHFFQWSRSYDSSPGGGHGGEYLLPSLAFSEGFANAFAGICRGDPLYIDTYGVGAAGGLSIALDVETDDQDQRHGIGSEETVDLVLWDLADGEAGGLADRDMDGVAIGGAALLRVMAAWTPTHGEYPYLGTLLDGVVAAGLVDAAALGRLAHAPAEQGFSYPMTGEDVWPARLAVPSTVMGRVDALSQPPAGSGDNPESGYHVYAHYRFELAQAQAVTLELTIMGAGTGNTDLGLELHSLGDEVLGMSDGGTPTELLTTMLQPGSYIAVVSAAGRRGPAAASYALSIR